MLFVTERKVREYKETNSVIWSRLLITSRKGEVISDCARANAELLDRTYLFVCTSVCCK